MNRVNGFFQGLANALFVDSAPDVVPTYEHSWPLSSGVTAILFLAAAAVVVYFYMRERGGASGIVKAGLASMRILLLLVLFVMLYGWMLRQHRVDLPDLVLIVDLSASMSVADHYPEADQRKLVEEAVKRMELEETTRLNLAKALLLSGRRPLLRELQSRYNLKMFYSDATPRKVAGDAEESVREAAAEGSQSRHGDVLRNILELQRGRPTAAVVMITDGVTTEGSSLADAADYARRKSTPFYAIGLGDQRSPRDVRVADLLVDEVVFAGDLINFDFKVAGSGYKNKRVKVRLKRVGQSKVLAEKTVTLGDDLQSRSLRLSYREEQKGEHTFVVEADMLPEEANRENNRLERQVSVREETIRVLLVQDYPNYEFRFLKTMLGRALKQNSDDKAFELTVVLQEADIDWAALDETAQRVFPVSRDDLFSYDVIIFGDVDRAHLSAATMTNLADFVRERGGGLVFIAGPRHTPLAYRDSPLSDLLPVSLSTAAAPAAEALLAEQAEYQPVPSRLGLTSPQFQLAASVPANLRIWNEMPNLLWLLDAPDLRPGARALMTHPTKRSAKGAPLPIVSMQFVGAGKVILHCFDESYRWSRHPDGQEHYNRYWLQTIRFLSRSKLLGGNRGAELATDRREYRRGDPVRLRVRFFDDRVAPPQDDGVAVVVEHASGKRQQLKLRRSDATRGVFEGAISNLADGDYRAWMATPTLEGQPPSQNFTVTAPLGEQARLKMDAAELAQAAKVTEGGFYTIVNADALLDDLPEGRKVRIESMPPEPIWNSSWLAGLFVILIVGEWLLRKKVGML